MMTALCLLSTARIQTTTANRGTAQGALLACMRKRPTMAHAMVKPNTVWDASRHLACLDTR